VVYRTDAPDPGPRRRHQGAPSAQCVPARRPGCSPPQWRCVPDRVPYRCTRPDTPIRTPGQEHQRPGHRDRRIREPFRRPQSPHFPLQMPGEGKRSSTGRSPPLTPSKSGWRSVITSRWWRYSSHVIARRLRFWSWFPGDQHGDIVRDDPEGLLSAFEDTRAQVSRVEQVTWDEDGVDLVFIDALLQCLPEREEHVALSFLTLYCR